METSYSSLPNGAAGMQQTVIDVKPPTKPMPRGCCGLFLTWLITALFGCLPVFTSCFQVEPNEEVLVLFWGRLNAV